MTLVVACYAKPVQPERVIGQVVVLVEHIGLRIGARQQGLLRDLLAHPVAGQVVGVAGDFACAVGDGRFAPGLVVGVFEYADVALLFFK